MGKAKEMPLEALDLVAERFKILSEPLRLMILQALQNGERSVGELTSATGASQPNISKHLKMLQTAGIVRREQRGNAVYYSIADDSIFTLCDVVCSSLEEHLRSRAEIFA
jgi:ArsR family transcriptional regulator